VVREVECSGEIESVQPRALHVSFDQTRLVAAGEVMNSSELTLRFGFCDGGGGGGGAPGPRGACTGDECSGGIDRAAGQGDFVCQELRFAGGGQLEPGACSGVSERRDGGVV
jgi:hypothetical protein